MGKNFWYKMPCNFFKRHDIMILRSLPEGDTLVLCFLILIGEAVYHDGYLRYSDQLPYTLDDLAVICGVDTGNESNDNVTRYVTLRNSVTIRYVTETLQKRGLITFENDGTIFIPLAQEMIGKSDNSNAERQRRYREKQKSQGLQGSPENIESNGNVTRYVTLRNGVTVTESKSKSKRKSKNILERDKENEEGREDHAQHSRFVKPTLEEVKAYCKSRCNDVDAEHFYSHYESNGWRVGKNPMKDWKASVRTWEKNSIGTSRQGTPYAPPEKIMENEYSKEHLAKREQESQDLLDQLLNE